MATDAYRRQFDFARYGEAVEDQQRRIREANEADKRLEAANAAVAACEEQMREALELSLAEVRVHAKERAAAQGSR